MKRWFAGDSGVVVSNAMDAAGCCVMPTGPCSCSLQLFSSSPSVNKSKTLQGCPPLFDCNGAMYVSLTNIILGTMGGRMHLEDNDIDLTMFIHGQAV